MKCELIGNVIKHHDFVVGKSFQMDVNVMEHSGHKNFFGVVKNIPMPNGAIIKFSGFKQVKITIETIE